MKGGKKYKLALFIFRRDLRLFDNTGLINAAQHADQILPCFIFDPVQAKGTNPYFGANCFQFLIQSLESLDKSLKQNGSKLYIFQGEPHKVIQSLISSTKAQAVYLNRDYTPYSIIRDSKIKKACMEEGVDFVSDEDILLIPVRDLPLGYPQYKVFTPFYNKLLQFKVKPCNTFSEFNFYDKKVAEESKIPDHDYNDRVPLKGGRQQGLLLLNDLRKNYAQGRNQIISHNSNLSPHNKFGTISIRQFYHKAKQPALVRQLYWRDFYYHVVLNNVGFSVTQKKYEDMKWKGDYDHLDAWKQGMTGVPIVDASMRCLAKTGIMHNRSRMIVASFLVKDLLLDWKEGEQHFAHYLVDYDPSQNNGGWQWASSTGCDSQPYFRIFNPQLQSQKFDSDCLFIREWIPELKDVPNKSIHKWESQYKNYKTDYPDPIVIHSAQKPKALQMYKECGYVNNQDQKQDNQGKQKKPTKRSRTTQQKQPVKKVKTKGK